MNKLHHASLVRFSPVLDYNLSLLGEFTELQDSHIERFGIDDARRLVEIANNCPANATVQTLVIRTDFITLEAQNALLKILEEPPASTQFVFVIQEAFQVLPTLASRFSEIQVTKSSGDNVTVEFEELLNSSYAERLEMIDKNLKAKNTAWQHAIKQGLLQYAKKCHSDILSELEYVARFLLTRGASNKFLLEHLALTLPTRS